MCVTLGQAKLSNTIIYAASVQHEGSEAHVLAYQNRAFSRGPNAMILPIPTCKELGPQNLIDTRGAPGFLLDLDTSTHQRSRSLTKGGGMIGSSVQMFDSGSYTVVLAENAEDIPDALQHVPVEKRPTIDASFFAAYRKLYPEWPIAVCCWSGSIQAEPLLWWYRPRHPDKLFFPTLDAHDGQPPRNENVHLDHVIIWGMKTGPFKPWFRDPLPETIQPFIAPQLAALRPNGQKPNGDFWLHGGKLERTFPGAVAL